MSINALAIAKHRERFFFVGFAALLVIIVFAGFARTFYLRPYYEPRPLIPLLVLHGVVFSSWLVLLSVQVGLVAKGRTRTHRRLGIAGGIIAVLMVIIGSITAVLRAKLIEVPPNAPPALAFLTIPLGDMFIFAILVGAGFYFRNRSDVHKRLMILATIAIMPAAIARLPFAFIQQGGPLAFFGLTDLLIIPCLVYDIVTRGRPHRATVLGGLLIVVSHPLRIVIGTSHAWLVFATWLTQWS